MQFQEVREIDLEEIILELIKEVLIDKLDNDKIYLKEEIRYQINSLILHYKLIDKIKIEIKEYWQDERHRIIEIWGEYDMMFQRV